MTSEAGSARILWVDDDNDLLLLVRRLLRGVVHLDACGSGEEAVLAMSRGPEYAVIVSDMVMPGMDGVRLLARVKERWPETVRMMFTGLDDQATAVQAMNDGRVSASSTRAPRPKTSSTPSTPPSRSMPRNGRNVPCSRTPRGPVRAL